MVILSVVFSSPGCFFLGPENLGWLCSNMHVLITFTQNQRRFILHNHRKQLLQIFLISSFLQTVVSLQFSPFETSQSFLAFILLPLLDTVKYYLSTSMAYSYHKNIEDKQQTSSPLHDGIIINPARPRVTLWQTAIADPAPFSSLSCSSGCSLPLVSL